MKIEIYTRGPLGKTIHWQLSSPYSTYMEFVVIGFDFAEGIVFLWNEVIE